MDAVAVYEIVRATYKVGELAYKVTDRKVAAWAKEQGISKEDAWQLARAEAIRRGDHGMEAFSDRVLRFERYLGPASLGNPVVLITKGRKRYKRAAG